MSKNAGYDNKGQYNGYVRNNDERAEFDFYATPPEEVKNILRYEPLVEGNIVLEPCCGLGHMIQGIDSYLIDNNLETKVKVFGTDLVDRGLQDGRTVFGLDFLSDDYPFAKKADIYVYVDRIKCYKNGDFSKKQSSAQSYSWFVFEPNRREKTTEFFWIRRADKL